MLRPVRATAIVLAAMTATGLAVTSPSAMAEAGHHRHHGRTTRHVPWWARTKAPAAAQPVTTFGDPGKPQWTPSFGNPVKPQWARRTPSASTVEPPPPLAAPRPAVEATPVADPPRVVPPTAIPAPTPYPVPVPATMVSAVNNPHPPAQHHGDNGLMPAILTGVVSSLALMAAALAVAWRRVSTYGRWLRGLLFASERTGRP